MNKRTSIIIPREVLLVEIERHCGRVDCNARTRIGLTKDEARAYCGFECACCERWNEDLLSERDVPDWWEELTVTGLDAVRQNHARRDDDPESVDDDVVKRMSDDYRRRAFPRS